MNRQRIFILFTACIFLIILTRLFLLQIVQGDYYFRKSQTNRIQLIERFAPRGRIYDAQRVLLVDNKPSYCAFLIPWLSSQRTNEVLDSFNNIVPLDVEEIKKRAFRQRFRPFQPILLAQNLSEKIVSKVLESQDEFPGIIVESVPLRYYPYGPFAAHLLGYIQEANASDIEKSKYGEENEVSGFVGQVGIEKTYEDFLKGVNGGTEIEVDVLGRPSKPPRILGEKEAIQGCDIVLTIDKTIQDACEEALGARSGAVVVCDPDNGDILAMCSSPKFNPAMFGKPISSAKWESITHSNYPMLNRAIQSSYPPGSIFKIIVATAAIEENKIDPSETFECKGEYKIGKRAYRCWNRTGHGSVNFSRAMAESCDIYFYHLGTRLGPEIIEKYSRMFGLGQTTGIDLSGERSGLVPSPDWKKRVRKERWFLGDTFNFSIGQGQLLATPLQMVQAMSVLYNSGKIFKPKIIKRVIISNSEKKEFPAEIEKQLILKPQTAEKLQEMLKAVVSYGTGRNAAVYGVDVMGKTGSAQTTRGNSHAWFLCYAKPDNKILGLPSTGYKPVTMVVFVENGGGGGDVACPIAAQIIRKIYQKPYIQKQTGQETEIIQ